jgi:hypothetical protein
MTAQREELMALVIQQIQEDVTRNTIVALEGLLYDVSNTILEDYLSDERLQAFWKKYPVS